MLSHVMSDHHTAHPSKQPPARRMSQAEMDVRPFSILSQSLFRIQVTFHHLYLPFQLDPIAPLIYSFIFQSWVRGPRRCKPLPAPCVCVIKFIPFVELLLQWCDKKLHVDC